MSVKKIAEQLNLRFFLRALAAWAVSALVLLLLSSLVVSNSSMGSRAIAYFSSAISFLAAVSAGAFGGRNQTGGLYTGLLTAAILSVLLLTVGFLIKGAEIDPAGVLSVVTFSFSGCLVGSVFLSGRKSRAKRKPSVLRNRR